MRSKASRRRNTLVRPNCKPARAHLDEKSSARNSCDDFGCSGPNLCVSVLRSLFSLTESVRSGSDKNAVREERKLDLLLLGL